ncbi:MAG: patatin-like phospholipase family protein [Bacteroidota bacterium]
MKFKHYALLALLFFYVVKSHGQRVGVVLSGGGATAMAHVGFLKALEENNIPIDYIVGTSMGAIVASYYASGYSIQEMDSLSRTKEFQEVSEGNWPSDLRFFYLEQSAHPAMVNLKYSGGDNWSNALPTNLIDPSYMDWNHMRMLGQANAVANHDFNHLFVPFRSVAADVSNQKEFIFREGNLNEAIRASATYPFFIPPIRVEGKLLYDGGIYNNFPIDVLYNEFLPDVILGCDVSDGAPEPKENDLMSQLEALIVTEKKVELPCKEIIVVTPNVSNVSTFDFEDVGFSIDAGYAATMNRMNDIQSIIERRVSNQEIQVKRTEFRSKMPQFEIGKIEVSGLGKRDLRVSQDLMGKKNSTVSIDELKENYFRILKEGEVKSIYPTLKYNGKRQNFDMKLKMTREKDLFVSFGGNYASRAISAGYIGLRYHNFGKIPVLLEANSYFGRFYGSVMVRVQGRLKLKNLPIQTGLAFTQNRWDFYKSVSAFFEDVKPSFILLNERTAEASLSMPVATYGKLSLDALYAYQYDKYYQSRNFLSVDTADMTQLNAGMARLVYERNTLNRPQYASSGARLKLACKFTQGIEYTIPGTTSLNRDTITNERQWYAIRAAYDNYFIHEKRFTFGAHIEGVYTNIPKFQNYTATLINCPTLSAFPELATYFLPQLRAPKFLSVGVSPIVHVGKSVDFRMDLYGFRPFETVLQKPNGEVGFFNNKRTFTLGSAALVFHSPIGPISLSANYYEQKENPWSVLLNVGLIISNKTGRE